jgi:hypothetical protein
METTEVLGAVIDYGNVSVKRRFIDEVNCKTRKA